MFENFKDTTLLNNDIKIVFKKHIYTKNEVEEHFKILLETYLSNTKKDTLTCYEYYNNANTLSAYEKYYYLDLEKSKIWTMYLLYDLESVFVENWNEYQVNKEGKFVKQN